MINPAAYTKFDSCKNASEFIVKHPDVYNVIRMMREMGYGVDIWVPPTFMPLIPNLSAKTFTALAAP